MPCWKASTKRILSIHTLGSLSHTRLYAMDMDHFKQAAAVTLQLPTRILGYTMLPLTRYFIEISFPFFFGKYPDTYGNKLRCIR